MTRSPDHPGHRRRARSERERWAKLVGPALSVASWATSASAHTLGLSSGEYRRGERDGRSVELTLSLARGDVARLVPALDADRDGHVTALEVERAKGDLEARLVRRVTVRAPEPCVATLTDAALADQDGLLVRARFVCRTAGEASVDVGFMEDLPRAHRHVARVVAGESISDHALTRDAHVVTVPAGAAVVPSPESAPSFVGLGLEHVLSGPDHLLFLFGLALARAKPRRLALLVTSFTVGHCASLALVALEVVVARPRVVEPLIAASVIYAGVHNLRWPKTPPSWLLTGAFGLVHGAGFAAALAEHPVTRSRPVYALLTFNVGVELAQLVALVVAVPLVALIGEARLGKVRVRDGLSALVAAAGLAWLVERLIAGG